MYHLIITKNVTPIGVYFYNTIVNITSAVHNQMRTVLRTCEHAPAHGTISMTNVRSSESARVFDEVILISKSPDRAALVA